jgi:crossover junction endodeoxyribonuclease RuvC
MSSSVICAGLDLSLASTGFALKYDNAISLETIKTTPQTCANDLARLRYICSEIMRRIPKNVGMVCVEDFFTPQNPFQIGAAIGLAMLGATVRMALYEAGMPFYVVSPGQIKKFATGKGVGQKSIVVREVYKRWGIDAKDDNQADACVLAYFAESILCLPSDAPKYQIEVVQKVIDERPCYNIAGKGSPDVASSEP